MKQINNEVNENIYNLYHKRMLTKRPQYVYIFWNTDRSPYEIKQLNFRELERFYDMHKDDIYTIEADLDKALEYADHIIVEDLNNLTIDLNGDYDEEFNLYISLYGNIRRKDLIGIDYIFRERNQNEYQKIYHCVETINGAE